MNYYITEIKIEKLRHLSNINIYLKEDQRKNLLLTGKNGSGKTTVLKALKKYLTVISDGKMKNLDANWPKWMEQKKREIETAKSENEKFDAQQMYEIYYNNIKKYRDGLLVAFNQRDGLESSFQNGQFILAYYGADRKTDLIKQNGVEDVVLDRSYSLESNPGKVLLKYLVHLKTQQAYARNEHDMAAVELLDQWFARFEEALKVLLDNESIALRYDYKNYNFQIIEDGRNAFGFDQLSDGYSAVIQIVADLILRMEQNWLKDGYFKLL